MLNKYIVNNWIKGFKGVADIVKNEDSFHSFEDILVWVENRKNNQNVSIDKISLDDCKPWFLDHKTGNIKNIDGSFFQISGIEGNIKEGKVTQPIIIQKEIGFLGIICKKINGIWHFLMQAKIEPGNINYVQISPTLQATKSNFTKKHGGKEPLYLDLFLNMKKEDILVDQIQSEQSSRFLGKRNRNVIIKTDKEIEELPSHRWMTLRQIKECMKYDNLVNMDTRTVLSCIPFVFIADDVKGYSKEFINSIKSINHEDIVEIYKRINDYKMFYSDEARLVPLLSLEDWSFADNAFRHKEKYPFEVIFCKLNIEGREVTRWNQPLFASLGVATFGLLCCDNDGKYEVLIQIKPEIGCFDAVELGPSVQEECGNEHKRDSVADSFFGLLERKEKTLLDVILSEEGGRFYHEQNRNVIMVVDKDKIKYDPDRYIWVSLGTLNALTQINNCLNIQLRNLLMLLSMHSDME